MNKPSFIIDSELIKYIKKVEKKRRDSPENLESFKPEHSTQCDRRILYRVLAYKPDTEIPKEDNIEKRNYYFNKWNGIFSSDENVMVLESDKFYSDMIYNVSGRIDMTLHFENHNITSICMIRGVDDNDFKRILENGPFKKDVITDMVYMWLSEIPNALMIYENFNKEEFEMFHVKPYNPIIQAMREKYQALMPYKLHGILKDRPYEDANAKECINCEFKTQCWK